MAGLSGPSAVLPSAASASADDMLRRRATVPEIAIVEADPAGASAHGKSHNSPAHSRHVSFDESPPLQPTTSASSTSSSAGPPFSSRKSTYEWAARRLGRSLSPANRNGASRSPSPLRAVSPSPDRSRLDAAMSTLALETERAPPAAKRSSSGARYVSLFKKHYNPEDPETDDERRVREHLAEVIKFIRKQRIGMMTIRNLEGYLVASAIVIAQVEYGIDFVFHANSRTVEVEALDDFPHINLSFQNSETAEWVSVAGKARLLQDEESIKELLNESVTGYSDRDATPDAPAGPSSGVSSGVIKFTTRSIAYSIGDDFKFIPMSSHNGIVRGEIQVESSTIKLDEQQIKTYRKRQKYMAAHPHIRMARSRTTAV
ncbi:uncharacterized protein V1518DRAFT_444757 [Limtongia smithiae]|uniref:uncharacterized protein n=1 Tax=Limtongia smithiae TaxID=1125753 RepID=UPI0034CE857F